MARSMAAGMLLIAAASLSGCGGSGEQKKAAADAKAAGFTPPAVTSRIDYGTAMERRFRALDRNADDRITRDELPRRNAPLIAFDRDGDGAVSAIEFSEGSLKRFDAMDLNHDGTVTSEEQNAWRAANRARRQGDDPVGDAPGNQAAARR